MATLKELTDILKNSNLTDQQIGELLTSLTAMQKENEDAEKGKNKVVLPPELLALLEKCTLNRGQNLVCPKCGSVAVSKNGKRNGRQRCLCKDCHKTFGDTFGTLLYHSRLTVDQWREGEQDSFPSIVEGDEFYIPLSFIGERNKAFFLEELKRMPRHNRNRADKYEYVEQAGYEVAEVEDMAGFKDDDTIPSALAVSKELNGLDKEEKRKRGISNEQVCVLTAVDKLENTYLAPSCVGKIEPKHLEQHWGGKFAEDSILVTDSLRAYRTFANNNKIHLRQIPSGKHTSGPFNLGKVNSYHSKLTAFMAGYKEVAFKYLDHYLALFRWQEKNSDSRTAEQADMLLDMLTRGVPNKVYLRKLKYKAMPFDTKGLIHIKRV